jgi:alpha-tubulin suppressor-like RCC1 family protein
MKNLAYYLLFTFLMKSALAPGQNTYVKIAAGAVHSLALKTDGTLWAWGYNADGQLGDSTFVDKYAPVQIGAGYAAIAAGNSHSLALKTDGTLWAWGLNAYGQLGDGTIVNKNTPVLVGSGYAAISAGYRHSLALRTDGTLWTWGGNIEGQLGDGTLVDKHTPVQIGSGYATIGAADYNSLALKTDGTLWAWGFNAYGQLGDGTQVDRNIPVLIGSDYATIAAGSIHTLALKTDGTLWAWGFNGDGELGDGTVVNKFAPVQIGPGYSAISSGYVHSLALKTDGTLWAWGFNYFGQVGDGTLVDKHTPVMIDSGYAVIAAGSVHSLALKTNGTLWAWGSNSFGQLGDGTQVDRHSPVRIGPGSAISFSPSSGPIGTAVTITGTNFSTIPAENVVYFGATKATVNSATASQLVVTVPAGATYQPITVTGNGLTAYSNSPFIVTFPFTGSIGASFANRTDFWAGYLTKSGAVSDLDGDGKPDLVAVDQVSNVVSVLRNVSIPGSISWDSFEPKVDFATGPGPYAVATGDLDGDGKPDLVVANSGGTSISIFRNTSTAGTVSFAANVEFEVVAFPDFIAIADLDLDGKSDIAVASSNTFAEGTVSILRNTSTVGSISSDSFAPRVDFAAAHGGIWCVRLDDVDGDGKGDITVTNGGDALVSIFRNISIPGLITSSSFESKVDFATGAYPGLASWADLDGDHKPDLVVGNSAGNSVSLFRNTSSAGIINSASLDARVDLPSNNGPWNPVAGDLTGDGKLDIIVRDASNGTLLIQKNISSPGTLSAHSFSQPYVVETGGNSLSIFVGDMDGDGKSDLTLSNEWTNVISVFRNEDIFEPSGPSSLTFNTITNTTLTAHFLASPDSVDGYIAIRRIGSSPNPPINGTTYSIGQLIGEDVVAYIGSNTTFTDSGLAPGVEYYYNCYAYHGAGETIDYVTSKWAANVAFTIGIDKGPIVSVSPTTFTLDDQITVTFDATRSFPVNALVDASTIYMYSAAITEGPESGNWNLNYVNFSAMTSLGDNKWSITFTPRYFYNSIPRDLTVYRLAMVFFDGLSHRGVSFDGRDIYLPVLPTPPPSPPTALPATFVSNTGFEAEWKSVDGITEYHLDVSLSDTVGYFVGGYENKLIYAYTTGTIRSTVTGLLPNTTYFYRVRAAGISGNSATISVTTLVNPPMSSSNVWVKQFGGPGEEEIQAMTSDDKGNIYAAGHFTGTITFGSNTLTSKGEYDIFFVRVDPKGNVVWARSIGSTALDNEVSLTTDSKGLYMTAQFAGDIDVDPGAGTTVFTNEGQWWVNDGFFARYDLSDGSLIWAHKMVDAFTWSSSSIGIDQTGVYLAGHYSGTVDFDPGRGQALRSSQGADDAFLAKYSLNGKYLWAGSMGGYYNDTAWGVRVDDSGIYITGSYGWGSDFDPTSNYYFLDGQGGFFGRYDLTTGNLIYVKNAGNGTIYSLDKHGRDLYIGGDFNGTIDADPDAGTHFIGTEGLSSGLIAKYNLLDGSYRWAKSLVTTGFIGPRKMLADGSGVYASGYFGGSVDFDGGPTENGNRTSGGIDAFAARYDVNGSLDWAKGIGSPGGFAVSIAAALTEDGYYMGGLLSDTVNFDPYNGSVIRISNSATSDVFIARYRLTKKVKKDQNEFRVVNIAAKEDLKMLTLFPNPTDEILRIDWHGFESDESIEVRIMDLFGRPVMTRTMSADESAIDVTGLSPGYYIFQARQNDITQIQRFMKK